MNLWIGNKKRQRQQLSFATSYPTHSVSRLLQVLRRWLISHPSGLFWLFCSLFSLYLQWQDLLLILTEHHSVDLTWMCYQTVFPPERFAYIIITRNMVCGLRNDKTPEVTSRETCLPALFLENKSRFMKTIILWLWKWIIKEEIGTYLHLWSGRIVEGHIMEFNFTLNSIQLVTIFWHAVNEGFLE